MKQHSTSSPNSSTDLTQPTGEEGTMPSHSDDSPHLHSFVPPSSTVSDDSANPGAKIDLNLNDPMSQRDEGVAQNTTLLEDTADFIKNSEEIVGEEVGLSESESWEANKEAFWKSLDDFITKSIEDRIKEMEEMVGEKAFELSGKTWEEDNKNVDELNELGGEEVEGLKVGEEHKNVDDLKDNSVAVPQEIAMEAAPTTHSDQPLQSSIQGNDEAANPRTRIDPSLNEPPCPEDEDMAHQITLLKGIADYPSKKIMYPFSDCSASNDFIKNSVDDNVDPGKLEDKTNPPESESLEAQKAEAEAEAEAFELSGKTREEQHNKNVDDLHELGGEEMTGLKDNSEAVPQEIASEAALALSYEEAKKELADILVAIKSSQL